MRLTLKRLILILAVSLLVLNCQASAVAEWADTKKIGVLVPLTGGYATYGQLVLRGLELTLGKAARLAVEDSGTMQGKGVLTAAKKLLDIDQVSLVVVFGIDDAEVLAPLFNRARIPLVVAWDSSRRIEELGTYIFSTGFETSSSGESAASFMALHLGVRRASIIAEDSSYNATAVAAFKRRAMELRINIVDERWHNLGDNNYKPSLLQARAKNVDALYLMTTVPESLDAIIRQTKDLKIELPFVTNEILISSAEDLKRRGILRGCASWIPESGIEAILPSYYATYGSQPWNHGPLMVGVGAGEFIRQHVITGSLAPFDALKQALGPTRRLHKSFEVWCLQDGKFAAMASQSLNNLIEQELSKTVKETSSTETVSRKR